MVVVVVVAVVVVVIVDVVFVFVVVLNVDVVVQATSKVNLRLPLMEVEFGWVGGGQAFPFSIKSTWCTRFNAMDNDQGPMSNKVLVTGCGEVG